MAVKPILSPRRRRVHPRALEAVAVLTLSIATWGPVIAWAAGA